MEQEILPLKLEDLKEMKEFYLVVEGYKGRDRIKARLHNSYGLCEVDGMLMEVKKRMPHSLDIYLLADVEHIMFMDGKKIGEDVKEAYKGFIFNPEHIEFIVGRSIVMVGNATEYNLHDGSVSETLDKKVVLYFDVNEDKSSGTIACL